MDEGAILRLLADADLRNREMTLWGSNGVWTVDLVCDGQVAGRGVYKPRSGEAPLWDFPDGTLYKRERAAYLVARSLGWRFVPPTVIRTGPLGIGTVQWYVDHDARCSLGDMRRTHADDMARIAVFDAITNNADRKTAHCLAGDDGRLYAIDHGLTFHCDPKQRTVLAEYTNGPVDSGVLKALRRWRADQGAWHRLRAALDDLLEPEEIAIFLQRVDRLIGTGRMPPARMRTYWAW